MVKRLSKTRTRGFRKTAALVSDQVRQAGETRGFSETRLLTHWRDIAGADLAAKARPVDVSFAKGGMGGTLTLLTTGSFAPLLQAQLPQLQTRVNAAYGYAAIARIRITQTAPVGFSDGAVAFDPAPVQTDQQRPPSPQAQASAQETAVAVHDSSLRKALTQLGSHVFEKSLRKKATS